MTKFETRTVSRRAALRAGVIGVAAGVLGLPGCASPARVKPVTGAPRRRVARIAHFPDLHIQPELEAGRGVATALRHAQTLPDPPALVLTGGDLVMDAYDQGAERTQAVFDLLKGVLRNECSLPVRHTLGNHDIWGWNRAKSGLRGDEALYGKAYAVDALKMPDRYHWFDVGTGPGSWRVIVLDSVRPSREPGSHGYEAFLDEEQMDWLGRTLRDTPSDRWVLVCSHVPIISMSSLLYRADREGLRSPSSLMHIDAHALHTMFMASGNVRLALGGHLHQRDRAEHGGVSYLCGGAVCGAWWKGPNKGCGEGYGLVDLFTDGTFAYAYQEYGWKAAVAPEKA